MKRFLLTGLFQMLLSYFAFGQYNNIWMLGVYQNDSLIPKCGLDFTNGTPDTFSFVRPMGMGICNASFCDSAGVLFCYSSGIYIANKFHDTLYNSKNFNPGAASSTVYNLKFGLPYPQSVLFLPLPGHSNQIIVFHESGESVQINMLTKGAPLYLKYSIIDMNLDSGKGGIIANKKALNVVHDTLLAGYITACKHGNGRDWWILAQKAYDTLFYKLLVTPDTIEVFTQQTGSMIFYDGAGGATFSPDGTKYTLVTQNKSLDIWDFDRCSGMLSNYVHITPPDTFLAYVGSSISPNNRYLYISTNLNTYQYDLQSVNIDSSVQTVAVNDSFPSPYPSFFSAHQLGPDGKIYICTWDGCDVLHVIDQPDSIGLTCNILQHSIKLPLWNWSVPNHPNYNLGRLQGSSCDTLQWAAVQEQEGIRDFKIYPNPVRDNILNIGYLLPLNKSGSFTIYDVTGKMVFKYTLPQWSTLQKFNLPELSDGVYSCVITSNGYRISKKMVVMKE